MKIYVQAIRVDSDTINNATFDHITAIVIPGIKYLDVGSAILCSGGIYIDIRIRHVRHLHRFDLTKDELNKAVLGRGESSELVTYIEWEKI